MNQPNPHREAESADEGRNLEWFMSNGWKVYHNEPTYLLTGEANAANAWGCERTQTPYCTNARGSNRNWLGTTWQEAVTKSVKELSKEFPALAARATKPEGRTLSYNYPNQYCPQHGQTLGNGDCASCLQHFLDRQALSDGREDWTGCPKHIRDMLDEMAFRLGGMWAASGDTSRKLEIEKAIGAAITRGDGGEELRAVAQEARDTFLRYEKLHRAKGTEDSTQKAEVNAALAAKLTAALACASSDEFERGRQQGMQQGRAINLRSAFDGSPEDVIHVLKAKLRSVTDMFELLLDDEKFPTKGRTIDDREANQAWWEDRYELIRQAKSALDLEVSPLNESPSRKCENYRNGACGKVICDCGNRPATPPQEAAPASPRVPVHPNGGLLYAAAPASQEGAS